MRWDSEPFPPARAWRSASAPVLHAQLEDTPHYHCRHFVHDPFRFVLRVFTITERNIGCQGYTTLALCFLHSPDFAAGGWDEKGPPTLSVDGLAGGAALVQKGFLGFSLVVETSVPCWHIGNIGAFHRRNIICSVGF